MVMDSDLLKNGVHLETIPYLGLGVVIQIEMRTYQPARILADFQFFLV